MFPSSISSDKLSDLSYPPVLGSLCLPLQVPLAPPSPCSVPWEADVYEQHPDTLAFWLLVELGLRRQQQERIGQESVFRALIPLAAFYCAAHSLFLYYGPQLLCVEEKTALSYSSG